jgi:hypothetical protein
MAAIISDALKASAEKALQSQYIYSLNASSLQKYKDDNANHPDFKKMWQRMTHTIKSIANGAFQVDFAEKGGLCIEIEYPEDGKKQLPLHEIDRIADKYMIKIRNVEIGIIWFM